MAFDAGYIHGGTSKPLSIGESAHGSNYSTHANSCRAHGGVVTGRKPGLSYYDNAPTERHWVGFDSYFATRDTNGQTDEEWLNEYINQRSR